MRTDLISRSAVLEMAFCAIKPTHDCQSVVSVVNVEDIENIPAIDAVPVVHARWKDHCCTNCFAMCVTARSPQDWVYNVETAFCPNCGARMDEKSEEDADGSETD